VALQKLALDQFAKGINFFVPHGTWYDNNPAAIVFPPELSFRSEKFADPLRAFNDNAREWGALFQASRPVHELAMLYPIEDLQAHYDFTQPDAYNGGTPPAHSDYLALGEWLMYDFMQDFVHLHPSVLAARDLSVFRAIVVPGMEVIGIETLRVLRRCKDSGCAVFGTHLPKRPVEPEAGEEFKRLAEGLFSPVEELQKVPFSVRLECAAPRNGGHLAWTRRRNADGDFLFIANSTDEPLDITLSTPSGRTRARIAENTPLIYRLP